MRPLTLFLGLCLVGCPAASPPPLPFCGDGTQDPLETCDDGNTTPNDGCNELCQAEICGDNVVNGAEECDDGANVNGDGCTAQCQNEVCGDGNINNNGEECDDGGAIDGDGCSATCLIEPPTSGQLRTFLVDTITIPNNNAEVALFGSDYNGDGLIDNKDNSLADLNSSMLNAGISLQIGVDDAIATGALLYGFDTTADDLINDPTVQVLGYLAALISPITPLFNGADLITPLTQESLLQGGTITNSLLRAGPSDFIFGLPLDAANPTKLPMKNSRIEATISANNLSNGKLTGTILATDFAPVTQDIADQINQLVLTEAEGFGNGTAIPCQNINPCQANGGVCTDTDGDALVTGVCIDPNAPVFSILFLTDKDKDGIIEVNFNAGTGTFAENEVSLFFDIVTPGGAPTGIIGGLFRLDLDQNNVNDSIGFGVGITAVTATRQ